MTTIFDFRARRLGGAERPLSEFRGQVLLIVNTASRCGFTPQYQGLEALHRKYAGQGLAVLGFPCNQFGRQEPGSAGDIAAFCSDNYDVSFPMFEKIDVNGPSAHPLYVFLKGRKAGLLGLRSIKWNFTKFLIARDGAVRARYAPFTTPERLDAVIARAL
jgi:glutathione peroxidase